VENLSEIEKPKTVFFKKLIRIFLYVTITIVIIFLSLIGLLFYYQNDVKTAILNELNKHLKSEVIIDPENINLTIIKTFPDCSVEFKNVLMLEALKLKKRDTLLFAEQFNLHFNISDLWNKNYHIKKVKFKNSIVKLQITASGKPNYIFWQDSKNSKEKNDSISFKLNLIQIENCRFVFRDKQTHFKTDLLIKEISFKGDFSQTDYDMSANGNMLIRKIETNKQTFITNKNCNLKIGLNIKKDVYTLEKTSISLNDMLFILDGDFKYNDSLQNLNINYTASNLDIGTILSLLPEQQKQKSKDYESDGVFYTKGKINYDTKTNFKTKSEFGIKNGTVTHKSSQVKATNINIVGKLDYSNNSSKLELNSIFLKINNDEVAGNLLISNFSEPHLKFKIDATSNLENLNAFWPIDTLTKLKGILKINLDVDGLWNDVKNTTNPSKINLKLDAGITNLEAQFKGDESVFMIQNCILSATNKDVQVKDLKLQRGNSDLLLNGTLPGLFKYLSDNTAPLIIEGSLLSNNFKLEDFMSKYNSSQNKTEPLIPKNIQFKLNATILKFAYEKFEAANITGEVEIKNQQAIVSDTKLSTMNGYAEFDAFADNSKGTFDVVLQSKLHNINVNKMFNQFNNFGQATLLDKNINGILNSEIEFSGSWNNALESDLNSIKSNINLTIDRGELIDFKPLQSLSKFVDVQELQKIKFSKLQSLIEIKDKTIFLPNSSIKNSVLNLNVYGSHTFNNEINYHIELLISELLAKKRKNKDNEFGPIENDPQNKRSAFILMTGTIDKPIIKYDRKGLKDNIKNDLKEEKQNLKQLLKEELGLFKKDTIAVKNKDKSNQKFELEKSNNNSIKKTLEPKKKETDDDDF